MSTPLLTTSSVIFLIVVLVQNVGICQGVSSKKMVSIGKFPAELEGKYLNLYIFKNHNSRSYLNKILVQNRSVNYTDTSSVADFYMLQNPQDDSFIYFLWDKDLVLMPDSVSFYDTKVRADLNDKLVSADSMINAHWTLRTNLKHYVDSLNYSTIPSQGGALDSLKKKEKELQISSFNQYINLILNYVSSNPSSIISLHYLRFNQDLLPPEKVDSISNFLSSNLKKHPWYLDLQTRSGDYHPDLKVGMKAPSFVLMDLYGKEISSKRFLGKYLLIDFWGTWCKPCLENIPFLKSFYAIVDPNKCQLLSIACETNAVSEYMINFTTQKAMIWPQVAEYGVNNALTKSFAVFSFPTTILIDPDGIVSAIAIGEEEIQNLLEKLKERFK